MKKWIWLPLFVAACLLACSRGERYGQAIARAERLVAVSPDSALKALEDVNPSDLDVDSLRALYAVVVAGAHKAGDNSMDADSLTGYAFEYYRGRDLKRFLQAGDLYALHRFWMGDGHGALALLDSLINLPDVPPHCSIELLRSRIAVGGQLFEGARNIAAIRQLMGIDTAATMQQDYKHQLYLNYTFMGENDSALIVLDELIDDARQRHLAEELFSYTYEKIGVLEESGRYEESNRLADYVIEHAPENDAMPFLRFWKALNYLNLKDYAKASEELAIADKYIADAPKEERNYYESFAGHIRDILAFHHEGKIKIVPLAELYNSQRDRWLRDENTRDKQRRNALKAENRALAFKAQSERKTYIIVIVSLLAFIFVCGGAWLLQKRKRRAVDAEERAETLQRMVDELRQPAAAGDSREALRRAMLQQLSIIKMVAEAPTEQNREMLRKISSVDAASDGQLVNWANMYDIVDNLHSGFYSKLHSRYGSAISEKEEQTIVLLAAGFSAKEISVVTSQSAASVYVRKSSVKKKLAVPENEDAIAFLRRELGCCAN